MLIVVVVLFSIINSLRADNTDGTIQWTMLVFSLFGGLSLFLFGMEQMSEGMKKTAGDKTQDQSFRGLTPRAGKIY